MYLKMDLFSPRLGEYLLNTKAKNRVLNHWPRKTVNINAQNIEVFDKLFIYNNGVLDTPNHRKLYQIMGISIEELQQESFDGVEQVWLYFDNKKYVDTVTFTHQDLYDFAYGSCTSEEWYTTTLEFITPMIPGITDINNLLIGTARTDAITTTFNSQFNQGNEWQIINTQTYNPATFIAIQDIEQILFDRQISIGASKSFKAESRLFSKNRNQTFYKTNIQVRFRIKDAIPIVNCTTLFNRIDTSDFIDTDFYNFINIATPTTFISDDTNPFSKEVYLPVSSIEAMLSKEFGKFLPNALESDYKEEEKEWWEVLLAIVLVVFVAWLFPPLAGATFTAVATSAAIFVTVSTLVLMAVSYIMTIAGNYGGAIFMGRVMVVLSKIGAVLAIINAFQAALNTLQQGLKVALNGMMSSFKNLIGGLKEVFNFISTVENTFADDIEKQGNSQDAEQDIEAMNSPINMQLVQENFDNYTYLDINEQMDSMVYDMTQGKVDKSTTKYFR